jgi:hypothetical protein
VPHTGFVHGASPQILECMEESLNVFMFAGAR